MTVIAIRLKSFLAALLSRPTSSQLNWRDFIKFAFPVHYLIYLNPRYSFFGKMVCYHLVPVLIFTAIISYAFIRLELNTLKERGEDNLIYMHERLEDLLTDYYDDINSSLSNLQVTASQALEAQSMFLMDEIGVTLQNNEKLKSIYIAFALRDDPLLANTYGLQLGFAPITAPYMIEGNFVPMWSRDDFDDALVKLEPNTELARQRTIEKAGERFASNGYEGLTVIDPYEKDNQLVIEMVKPIIFNGQFKGIVGVQLEKDYLLELLETLRFYGDTEFKPTVMIFDPQKRILSSTFEKKETYGQTIDQVTAFDETFRAELSELFETLNVKEEDSKYELHREAHALTLWDLTESDQFVKNLNHPHKIALPFEGWLGVTMIDYSSSLVRLNEQVEKIAWFTAVFLIFLFSLQMLIVMNHQRRLSKLVQGNRQLVKSDQTSFVFDAEQHRKDEIGRLYQFMLTLHDFRQGITDFATAIANGDFNVTTRFDTNEGIFNILDTMRHNRQNMEKILLEQRRLLEGLLDNDRIAASYKDNMGRYRFVNAGWEKLMELSREDALGKTDRELFEPSLAEFIENEDRNMNAASKPILGISQVGHARRGLFYEFYKYPVVNTARQLNGIAFIAYDITEKSRENRILLQQTNQYESILAAIPYPAILLDEFARIKFLNDEAIKLFAIDLSEVKGESINKIKAISTMDAKTLNIEARQAIQHGGDIDLELSVAGTDGIMRSLKFTARGFYGEDKTPNGLIGCFIDITDYRTVEHALRSQLAEFSDSKRASLNMLFDLEQERKLAEELRDEAQAATRAKASFLAAMSHEIRTPMNGVIGIIDLLRETHLDNDQMQMTRTIRDSAFSLLQIINDILDFSKIEAGKMLLEAIPISIQDTVEGVCETLLPDVTKKKLKLHNWVDSTLPSRVNGDQIRLRQILFNILGNAIKFTETTKDKTGHVSLWAYCNTKARTAPLPRGIVPPPPPEEGTEIVIQIVDSGVGMSQEVVNRLFQPFTQAESSTTRRFGGTGLGLTISRDLVTLMGGRILIDSEEGKGSTFSIILPLVTSDDQKQDEAPLSLKNKRVAILIEDQQTRDICLDYLEATNANVTIIKEAQQLIPMLKKESILDKKKARKAFDTLIIEDVRTPSYHETLFDIRLNLTVDPLNIVLLSSNRLQQRGLTHPDMFVIDNQPIKRTGFLRGVGIALGKISPTISKHQFTKRARRKVPTIEEAIENKQMILVAEDNLTNQEVIRRQLATLGYVCDIADNGEDALTMMESRDYNLLLTDCHMPVMDGYELTINIRKTEQSEPEQEALPIVAITANALQGEGERCLEIGMNDYLTKPLELEKLRSIIERWLPSSKVIKEDEQQEEITKKEAEPKKDLTIEPAIELDENKIFNLASWQKEGIEPELTQEILEKFVLTVDDIETILNQMNNEDYTDKLKQKLIILASTLYAQHLGEVTRWIIELWRREGTQQAIDNHYKLHDAIDRTLIVIHENLLKTTSNDLVKARLEKAMSRKDALFNVQDAAAAPSPQMKDIDASDNKDNNQDEASQTILVNPVQLLRDFDDDYDLVKEILSHFVDTAPEDFEAIVKAAEDKDIKRTGEAGHKMKSASRAIGADQLADICASIEEAGKNSDLNQAQTLVEDLKAIFDTTLKAIADFDAPAQ